MLCTETESLGKDVDPSGTDVVSELSDGVAVGADPGLPCEGVDA